MLQTAAQRHVVSASHIKRSVFRRSYNNTVNYTTCHGSSYVKYKRLLLSHNVEVIRHTARNSYPSTTHISEKVLNTKGLGDILPNLSDVRRTQNGQKLKCKIRVSNSIIKTHSRQEIDTIRLPVRNSDDSRFSCN